MLPLTAAEIITRTAEECERFESRTEPWATADLCEAIECATDCDVRNLPVVAFDRWLECLRLRDAAGLDYDSIERIEERLSAARDRDVLREHAAGNVAATAATAFAIGDRVVSTEDSPRECDQVRGTVQCARPGQPVHVLWDYQSIYSPADTVPAAHLRKVL